MLAGAKAALPENNRRDQHEVIKDNPSPPISHGQGINIEGRVAGVNVSHLSKSEKRTLLRQQTNSCRRN